MKRILKMILLNIIVVAFLSSIGCSQKNRITVIQDKKVLQKFIKQNPMPVPKERSYQGLKPTAEQGLLWACILHRLALMKLPSYCKKKPKQGRHATPNKSLMTMEASELLMYASQKTFKNRWGGMEADIYAVVAEQKRILENQFHDGEVLSTDGNQAIVNIHMSDPAIKSGKLTMLCRTDLQAGEPVLVILPTAQPDHGYVLPLLPTAQA